MPTGGWWLSSLGHHSSNECPREERELAGNNNNGRDLFCDEHRCGRFAIGVVLAAKNKVRVEIHPQIFRINNTCHHGFNKRWFLTRPRRSRVKRLSLSSRPVSTSIGVHDHRTSLQPLYFSIPLAAARGCVSRIEVTANRPLLKYCNKRHFELQDIKRT